MSQHSSTSRAFQKTRIRVLDRDGWTCLYCGNGLVEGHKDLAPEVDHITPKSKGGTDSPSNLVAVCRKCNNDKSDRELVRSNWWNTDWLTHL
jgi:5-methylcytosine-specific restriction endonuclease McrA